MASAWPWPTFWPGSTSRRETGPEIGESTLVAWSLSKSTTPAASITLWKAVGATETRVTCFSCSDVRVMSLGVVAAASGLESDFPEQAESESTLHAIADAARSAFRTGLRRRLVGIGVLARGLFWGLSGERLC